jgi:hypothetical protein
MDAPFTMPFERFWSWLLAHPNCILRAGTPDSMLYDDDDLHWHFAAEGPETLLVQVLRGKRLMAELLVDPEPIAYVQAVPLERQDEHVFELIVETDSERFAAYSFTLVHGIEEDEEEGEFTPARVH